MENASLTLLPQHDKQTHIFQKFWMSEEYFGNIRGYNLVILLGTIVPNNMDADPGIFLSVILKALYYFLVFFEFDLLTYL